ncbi:ornithine lipid ester-linked acyl 2-hydroxylase-like [Dysidea avara]|uniref:ornithine lipid ester-linked acyl 2-hydroxylase-like n=1 Tax=Dysidea avara TaxID=196820 RepID=UPI00332A1247
MCFCWLVMKAAELFIVLILLFAGSNSDAKKDKQIAFTIAVQGQDDIQFYEGDDPCKVIKKYCKGLTRLFPYEKCFELLHAKTSTQIGQLWSSLHQKLKINEGLFIKCDPFRFDAKEYIKSVDRAHLGTTRNSTAVIHELLNHLKKAMQKDERALALFNTRRNQLELSDLEKVLLYRKALLLIPTNLFVVDQFGLALIFVDREEEARALFANAVVRGLWGNPLQRPVSKYVKGLTAKPWHDKKDYPFIAKLEAGADEVKKELLHNLKQKRHMFTGETENLHVGGEWTELRIKSSGHGMIKKHTDLFSNTMKVIEGCGEEFVSIKFSAIQPGTHIRTHTGPSNERLRLHLTLVHTGGARIRVGTEWRTWEEGKAIIFDDSWEHEVIHTGEDMRVVLIMDIWHPELPPESRVVH